MKRSYPYTGPGASPQATAPAAPSAQPDYSAYGYGTNSSLMTGNAPSAGLSQEAQQAQWHQQWQQYYAQQAASGGGHQQPQQPQGRPPPQTQQQAPAQQPQAFAYQQQPPPPQPQYYGQQYHPQQQQQQQVTPPFTWNNQQQPAMPAYPQAPQNFAGPAQPNFFAGNTNQGNQGPAKRPRFDMNNQRPIAGRPMMAPVNGQMGAFQGSQAGVGPHGFAGPPSGPSNQNFAGNPSWQNGPIRPAGPIAGPHMGGPSNMAGPMASSPSGIRTPITPMADRKAMNNRPNRPQGNPNRPSLPSMPVSGAKFNGPVGVNALTANGRSGSGSRGGGAGNGVGGAAGPGARRIANGPRSGVPSGPSGKGNRLDSSKAKSAVVNKGLPIKTAGGFELNKAPALNGRSSTLADQPVPPSSKRTFSDFKINAIKIDPIDWQWQQGEGDEEDEDGVGGAGEEEDSILSTNDTESIDGNRKRGRVGKRKEKQDGGKEASRLRICFAANLPPPGAPTGPKALSKTIEKEEQQIAQSSASAAASSSADTEASGQLEWTAFSRGPPQSSTNRISISFASSKRRLVIDSEVIKGVEINRAEGTLKIVVNVTTAAGVKRKDQLEKKKGEEWLVVKGVLLEGREAEMDNFGAISRRELERCWREKRDWKGEVEDAKLEDDDEAKGDDEEATEVAANAVEVKKEDDGGGEEESVQGVEVENQIEATDDVEEDAEKLEAETLGESAWRDYTSLPPFYRLLAHHEGPTEEVHHAAEGSSEMIITILLAEVSPKQELKWVKTGDLEEWLSALPGFQSSLSNSNSGSIGGSHLNIANPVHAWTDKIRVLDPDPPPTIEDVLEDWTQKSFVGNLNDRVRFLQDHRLQNSNGIVDMICKLIRGDRANPNPNVRDLGEPLKLVMEKSKFHQNHLTLSIGALLQMMKDFANLANIDEEVVEAKMKDIFMCLPTHLIFRACDGLCKEGLEKQRLSNNTGRAKLTKSVGGGVVAAGASAGAGAGAGAKGVAPAVAETTSRDGSVPVGSVASSNAGEGGSSSKEATKDQEEEEEEEKEKGETEANVEVATESIPLEAVVAEAVANGVEMGGNDSIKVEEAEDLMNEDSSELTQGTEEAIKDELAS